MPTDLDKRIIGEFVKERWNERDEAETVETVKFDATRVVLKRDLSLIQELQDDDRTTDAIGKECVLWTGPHTVYLTDAIIEFFEVEYLEDITQAMLDAARAAFGDLELTQVTLQLTLKATYDLNGEDSDTLIRHLEHLVERAIGDGLLTGASAASVVGHEVSVDELLQETVLEES